MHAQKSSGGHPGRIDDDGQEAPLAVKLHQDIVDDQHGRDGDQKRHQHRRADLVFGDIAPVERQQEVLEDADEEIYYEKIVHKLYDCLYSTPKLPCGQEKRQNRVGSAEVVHSSIIFLIFHEGCAEISLPG